MRKLVMGESSGSNEGEKLVNTGAMNVTLRDLIQRLECHGSPKLMLIIDINE